MASFSHFWVLTLFLATVLRGSRSASSQSYDGGRAAQDLPSFSSATRKLLDHPTLIGKNSVLADGKWCVPTDDTSDKQLQANLDYACGAGANCTPIQPGGPCFLPNTVLFHATYAMNDYFQKHGRDFQACSFSGTGIITDIEPGTASCDFPGRVGFEKSLSPIDAK